MDWGLATQLLLLSNGQQKKAEAFGRLMGEPDTNKRVLGLYPWLIAPGAIFVFHTSQFETYPMLELFQPALKRYGLSARCVQVFYQRDGQPIYLCMEVVRQELQTHVAAGRFFYIREAEDWDSAVGGRRDWNPTASMGLALAGSFGRKGDFASYRVSVNRDVSRLMFHLRYSLAGERSGWCRITIDGRDAHILQLSPTGASGIRDRWQVAAVTIGALSGGSHELKIVPDSEGQGISIDYFYISEGDLSLSDVPASLAAGSDPELLGYRNRPDVSVTVNARTMGHAAVSTTHARAYADFSRDPEILTGVLLHGRSQISLQELKGILTLQRRTAGPTVAGG